jgi:hypothetical protein
VSARETSVKPGLGVDVSAVIEKKVGDLIMAAQRRVVQRRLAVAVLYIHIEPSRAGRPQSR